MIYLYKDGNVITEQDFRMLHKNISFPNILNEEIVNSYGYLVVDRHPQPGDTELETAVADKKVVNNRYVEGWKYIPKTEEQIIQTFTSVIQSKLDEFARTRGYDNIFTACTYITSPNTKFALEAQDCVDLRDAMWAQCYQILAEVKANIRPMPVSIDALLAELPVLVWTN